MSAIMKTLQIKLHINRELGNGDAETSGQLKRVCFAFCPLFCHGMGRGSQNKVNILEVPIVGIIAFRNLNWSHLLPETLNAHDLGKLQAGIREILITSGHNSLAL